MYHCSQFLSYVNRATSEPGRRNSHTLTSPPSRDSLPRAGWSVGQVLRLADRYLGLVWHHGKKCSKEPRCRLFFYADNFPPSRAVPGKTMLKFYLQPRELLFKGNLSGIGASLLNPRIVFKQTHNYSSNRRKGICNEAIYM